MPTDLKHKVKRPSPENGSNVVRYHKRYALFQFLLFLLIVGIFLATILHQSLKQEKADFDLVTQRLSQHVDFIAGNFDHLRTGILRLRMSAENDLFEEKGKLSEMHYLFQFAHENPEGTGFSLDAIGSPSLRERVGNLTGDGSLQGRSPEFYREISMALDLSDNFSRLFQVMPELVWIYYYSKNDFAMYFPWVPSTKTRFEKESYKLSAWTLGLPENNPERQPYWTEAYFDSVGKGLMTSCLAPIYDQDVFLGVVGADLSVDFLNDIVSSFEPGRDGTLFIIDQADQLLAAPGIITSTSERIPTFEQALPEPLKGIRKHLFTPSNASPIETNGWRLLVNGIPNTPFRSLYFERQASLPEVLLSYMGFFPFILLVCLVAFLLVFQIVTHSGFVRPSEKLVRHILNESQGKQSPIPDKIPSPWRPWFTTISQLFENNRSLTAQLQSRNEELVEEMEERKKAADALQESEERFRSIVENTNAGYFFIDRDGCFRSVNEAWLRLHKYNSPDEILGRHYMVTQLPEDQSRARELVERLLAGERVPEGQFTRLCKDGSVGWHTFSVTPVWKGGRVVGLEGFLTDITEQKKMEEALWAEKELSDDYINSLPGLFYVFDHERFVSWNKVWNVITGYDDEELASMYGPDFFEGSDRELIAERMAQAFQDGYSHAEATMVMKDGRRVPYYFNGVRRTFRGKEHLVGLGVDISERKRAETERETLQGQLEQAQKMESVGRLAGGVAHDFNNMLEVILGHTELAMKQIEPSQPVYDDLQEIGKAAQRSADLTRQLLAFARRQTVAPRVLDLNETVTGMLRMLHRLIGEDVKLSWIPGEDIWPVKMDPSQIDQLLANLCINARDAIADVGKITMETENITFDQTYCDDHQGFLPGDYVLLAVSDDGRGMDKETQAHIFEPFFTTKEVGEGTGLGLATVYGIVRQNEGFVNVYSEPGQGTTFRIYLPKYGGKPVRNHEKSTKEPAQGGTETIILVEDEPSILRLTTIQLEMQGYTVLATGSPGEAIELAQNHTGEIHLLMTDVVMPEMNGRTLAIQLRALYPGIKSLFMSGYTSNVIAHHGVLDEGVHFIQKPFGLETMAAKVRQVLDEPSKSSTNPS